MGPTMRSVVDYALAKNALLRAWRAGRVSRREICDAHPDLLRAASYSGDAAESCCPVCSGGELRLVSYAFSEGFSKRENGRVWPRDDLGPLAKFPDARLYTVEVCTGCSWNHLRSQISVGEDDEARGREAST